MSFLNLVYITSSQGLENERRGFRPSIALLGSWVHHDATATHINYPIKILRSKQESRFLEQRSKLAFLLQQIGASGSGKFGSATLSKFLFR